MSDDLWSWLMDQGWRVESYRPDRRVYLDIPASYVSRPMYIESPEREQLLAAAAIMAQPTATLMQ